MDTTAAEAFVDALPKVELHLHLEGSVRPATLLQLAQRHGTSSLPTTLDELQRFYVFRDFSHFVEVYGAVCDQLRDPEDFALIVHELGQSLARQNVRYAEVTFTPYNHMRRGVSVEAVFEGVERGRADAERDFGVQLRFCTDIPGEYGPEAGMATVRAVLAARPDSVVSFGLGGPEAGVPRRLFARPFAMAREAGLHAVPHAGETTGAATIWEALRDLRAERIGHGVRCLEDPALVAHLVAEAIPLEVCPTSNVRLSVVPSMQAHPLRRLLDAGLTVTLNSDDPPMFGTSLREEYLAALQVLGLTPQELVSLARNAVDCSFASAQRKASIRAEIDALEVPAALGGGA